ncbi:uncharacterized protein LOC110838726 isoform X2 [Zootermopsis nevadensis]|uniref:uncharacterized protein LOC110838726 isoform X2 n=1 Tax=Zootermopsis nevadensis TaxID=136037 RepID=UPI000B8EBEF1|nr:uncharacterized protein LOC110838726 isoform X2 [Zootermopsis nevadensis]
MRQKKLAHPKIKPARPLSQCKRFVSYSGRGFGQQPKDKRITKPGKIVSTSKDIWTAFYINGRPKFLKKCITLCHVVFNETATAEQFWEISYSHLPGPHAEIKVLRNIKARELCLGYRTRIVTLFLSYSPCANCANFIIEFSRTRPQCTVYIRFTCLFRHPEEIHRDGLRRLNAEPGISLGVFTVYEWRRLAEATGMPFRNVVPNRDAWDSKWKIMFERILADTVNQSTHVVSPNMTISDTPAPTEHQVTDPGTRWSSASSWDIVSRTQDQSNGRRRDIVLDITRLQIPHVSNKSMNQPAHFVPSQERECTRDMTIRAVPFPRENEVRAPASEWSRASSWDTTSRTHRENHEDREVLLDSTTIQIPQDEELVAQNTEQRKRNQTVCYVVLILGIILTLAITPSVVFT